MRYFKIIGVISLLIFSFYLTDFVTDIAINSNSLMQIIKNNKNNYYESPVNAIIKDNTIIPGINGKIVNNMDSFLNMKDFGVFNSNYLIYDYIKPLISVEDNKDKVIISGNKSKRNVALLIDKNNNINTELSKIKHTKLIKYNDNITDFENINIESDKSKFLDLEYLLYKKNKLKKICILDYSNIEACIKNKYYIVKPSVIIKNNNFNNNLNDINNGSIILIDNNLTLNNYRLLLSYIKNKNFNIIYLSEIIKE